MWLINLSEIGSQFGFMTFQNLTLAQETALLSQFVHISFKILRNSTQPCISWIFALCTSMACISSLWSLWLTTATWAASGAGGAGVTGVTDVHPSTSVWELVVQVYWWDISADRIRMLSSLQFPCLVSSALFTRHSSSLRCSDSNRLPSDLEASSHRTTRVRVGTWLFNQCHYEKRRPPVPLVLRRSTVRVTQ